MPMRQSVGTPSTDRVKSMTSFSLALPSDDRCDRPTRASENMSGDQPGRFAQGPDENAGLCGLFAGFIWLFLPEELQSVGGLWPAGILVQMVVGRPRDSELRKVNADRGRTTA